MHLWENSISTQDDLAPARPSAAGHRRYASWSAAAAVAAAGLLLAGAADAAEFHVGEDPREYEDLGDDSPGRGGCDVGDGRCTLRAAIEESNATPERDRILLYGGGEFELREGHLVITDGVTITGVGNAPSIDAKGRSRAIVICHPDMTGQCSRTMEGDDGFDPSVHIHNVKITGGMGNERVSGILYTGGGGIVVGKKSSLRLTNAQVVGNQATMLGGGILNFGLLVVHRSRIADNKTTETGPGGFEGWGGGVFTVGATTAQFEESLIENNSASIGGGIGNYFGVLRIRNSTLSGNHADIAAGGLLTMGDEPTEISFATITDNRVACVVVGRVCRDVGDFPLLGGGGMFIVGSVVLGNSILAGNFDWSDPLSAARARDCAGISGETSVLTAGNNIMGEVDRCPRISTPAGSGAAASDRVRMNPALAPLADNRGPTQTHALRSNSPAVDAVNFDTSRSGAFFRPLHVDQRGFARPGRLGSRSTKLDAGAYESGALPRYPDVPLLPNEVIAETTVDLLLYLPVNRAFDLPVQVGVRDQDVRVTDLLRATYGSAIIRVEVDKEASIGPRALVVELGEDTFEVPITVVIDRERAESVAVDIMPGTCPNSLAQKAERTFRAAFLGSKDFDPSEIDPASVRLEGVAPVSHRLTDVGAPAAAQTPACPEGLDEIEDLELDFGRAEVLRAAGPFVPGFELSLELTAALADGTPIRGHDMVVLAE